MRKLFASSVTSVWKIYPITCLLEAKILILARRIFFVPYSHLNVKIFPTHFPPFALHWQLCQDTHKKEGKTWS